MRNHRSFVSFSFRLPKFYAKIESHHWNESFFEGLDVAMCTASLMRFYWLPHSAVSSNHMFGWWHFSSFVSRIACVLYLHQCGGLFKCEYLRSLSIWVHFWPISARLCEFILLVLSPSPSLFFGLPNMRTRAGYRQNHVTGEYFSTSEYNITPFYFDEKCSFIKIIQRRYDWY